MAYQSYKELIVWQKAMDLADEVYRLTAMFPASEIYGISGQMRAASVSVPSNIAEGHGRDSEKSFLYHVSIARGSLQELETQLMLAIRLTYTNEERAANVIILIPTVGKLLTGLTKYLKSKIKATKAGLCLDAQPKLIHYKPTH